MAHKSSSTHRIASTKALISASRHTFEQYRCLRVISSSRRRSSSTGERKRDGSFSSSLSLLRRFLALFLLPDNNNNINSGSNSNDWTTIRTSCCQKRPDKESIYDSQSYSSSQVESSSKEGKKGAREKEIATRNKNAMHTTGCYWRASLWLIVVVVPRLACLLHATEADISSSSNGTQGR